MRILETYTDMSITFKSNQPEKGSAKGEIGNGHVDFHNILNRQKSYLHQILNAHRVNDNRHTEINIAKQ